MTWRARHSTFGIGKGLGCHLARAHGFRKLPHIGARPDGLTAIAPVQHGPARHGNRRQIAGRSPHHERGRGFIAAHHQNHPIHRVGADRLFNIHRGEVAKQHGRGPQVAFAARKHRKFQRQATRFQHACFDVGDQLAEMGVAGGEIAEGVANANDRPPVKGVIGQAVVFHPTAVDEAVFVLPAKPCLGS